MFSWGFGIAVGVRCSCAHCVFAYAHAAGELELELELELIQTRMTQKPMLWVEVGSGLKDGTIFHLQLRIRGFSYWVHNLF